MDEKIELYHIHRNGIKDNLWQVGNVLIVDNNFEAAYYSIILSNEKELVRRYGENYKIDYIISIMEEMIGKDVVREEMEDEFKKTLNFYYFLRREKALEEGRKIFNPDAPCRFNSLFLFEIIDLYYWLKMVGSDSYDRFLLELDGKIFESSDIYFPPQKMAFDDQVEDSRKYWQPKKKSLMHNEYIFQGKARILDKM